LSNITPIHDRFKNVLIPALIMGVLTNVYISTLILIMGTYEVLLSPVIASLIFVGVYVLLKRGVLHSKLAFFITSYTVLMEIIVHTHYFGWGCGFYYFMFLLPIVFLINPVWKPIVIILFNGSMVAAAVLIWYVYHNSSAVYPLKSVPVDYINFINATGTTGIVLVIMIYYSRTIYKKDEALIKANNELEIQNKEISAQHKNAQILIKEIHHRVKNNLQIISSLMSLQSRALEDSEAAVVLNESRRRVEAIALIHQKLYQEDRINRVDFKSYLHDFMNTQHMMTSHLQCSLETEEVTLNLDVAVPLGLIISELITNSLKHAFKGIDNPELRITLFSDADGYELIVKDNGVGLPKDFDLSRTGSLGTEIITALTEQISAKISFQNDHGAEFKILFQDIPVDEV
jgi:two-component sensor histidine kinase